MPVRDVWAEKITETEKEISRVQCPGKGNQSCPLFPGRVVTTLPGKMQEREVWADKITDKKETKETRHKSISENEKLNELAETEKLTARRKVEKETRKEVQPSPPAAEEITAHDMKRESEIRRKPIEIESTKEKIGAHDVSQRSETRVQPVEVQPANEFAVEKIAAQEQKETRQKPVEQEFSSGLLFLVTSHL